MSNTKIVEEYTYHGLGYPIKLTDVRFYFYDNEWLPIIDVHAVALSEYVRLAWEMPKTTQEAELKLIRSFEGEE